MALFNHFTALYTVNKNIMINLLQLFIQGASQKKRLTRKKTSILRFLGAFLLGRRSTLSAQLLMFCYVSSDRTLFVKLITYI